MVSSERPERERDMIIVDDHISYALDISKRKITTRTRHARHPGRPRQEKLEEPGVLEESVVYPGFGFRRHFPERYVRFVANEQNLTQHLAEVVVVCRELLLEFSQQGDQRLVRDAEDAAFVRQVAEHPTCCVSGVVVPPGGLGRLGRPRVARVDLDGVLDAAPRSVLPERGGILIHVADELGDEDDQKGRIILENQSILAEQRGDSIVETLPIDVRESVFQQVPHELVDEKERDERLAKAARADDLTAAVFLEERGDGLEAVHLQKTRHQLGSEDHGSGARRRPGKRPSKFREGPHHHLVGAVRLVDLVGVE